MRVVQCVSVCCSVLQIVRRVCVRFVFLHYLFVFLHYLFACCNVCAAIRCSVLQCVAVCCSVLQCIADRQEDLRRVRILAFFLCVLQESVLQVCCSVLQVFCSVLYCVAVCYSVLK